MTPPRPNALRAARFEFVLLAAVTVSAHFAGSPPLGSAQAKGRRLSSNAAGDAGDAGGGDTVFNAVAVIGIGFGALVLCGALYVVCSSSCRRGGGDGAPNSGKLQLYTLAHLLFTELRPFFSIIFTANLMLKSALATMLSIYISTDGFEGKEKTYTVPALVLEQCLNKIATQFLWTSTTSC